MFGSSGLRTGRKFFADLVAREAGEKLPPARLTRSSTPARSSRSSPWRAGAMNGWIVVDGSVGLGAARRGGADYARPRHKWERRLPGA